MGALPGAIGALAVVWALGAAWLKGRLASTTGLERLAARLAVGLAGVGVIATAFADLGFHYGWAIGLMAVLVSGLGLVANAGRHDRPARWSRVDLAIGALAAALLIAALPAFDATLGGSDAGTFANEAIRLQQRHATEAAEPALAAVPAAVLQALPSAGAFTGWQVSSPGAADQLADGFHLWPSIAAAAGDATGDDGVWSLAPIAALGLLSVAILALRLAPVRPEVAAVIAATLLAVNVAFVWFARSPTTGQLALAFLMTALWLRVDAARRSAPRLAVAAGLLAGMAVLTQPAAIAAIVAVAAFGVWRWRDGAFDRVEAAFCLAFGAIVGLATVHVALFAWSDLTATWSAAAGWPQVDWLTWYATLPGLGLAAVGLAIAVRADRTRPRLALIGLPLLLLVSELPVAESGAAQIAAIDRYLPVAIPLLAVFGGIATGTALAARRRAVAIVAIVAAAATVAIELAALVPTLRVDEHRGAAAQIGRLDAALGPPETLVLTSDARWGVPLQQRFARAVLAADDLEREPVAGWVTEQAAVRDVRVITVEKTPPALDPAHARAVVETTVPIALDELESVDGGVPSVNRRVVLDLVIWRIEPTDATVAS